MSRIELSEAQEQLSVLVERAVRGEEIVFVENNEPLVRLVAVARSEDTLAENGSVQALLNSGLIGLWKDRDNLPDSARFARHLREQAQQRTR